MTSANSETVTAVVFVLTQHLMPDADRCLRYCMANRYNVIGVVRDRWADAMAMLADGRASVLVVADDQHLDPNRQPRIEVVAQQHDSPRLARTRALRRNAAK